jgi:hypothetical protein
MSLLDSIAEQRPYTENVNALRGMKPGPKRDLYHHTTVEAEHITSAHAAFLTAEFTTVTVPCLLLLLPRALYWS